MAAAVIISALLAPGNPPRAETAPSHRIGLWLECEGKFRTLDDPGRLLTAVLDADALGATDLFVQVFRNGKAWFATELADDSPFRRALGQNYEPVSDALSFAHASGIRVHAWFNLLRVDDGERSAMVRALGRDAVLTDETGRSLLARGPWGRKRNVKPDTPGAWLDPSSPAVAARLTALLESLLTAHPALDGIHLDYARYPIAIGSPGGGADLGWSKTSRARFLAGSAGEENGNGPGQWNAWRREQLTRLIRTLRSAVKAKRPGLEFSAAVVADPKEAAERAFQDWPRWAEEGILDVVVPMNYHKDPVRYDTLARACVARRGRARMLMGVGAWRFGDRVDAIAARVHLALASGAQGAVLFSHDNLKSHPQALRRIGALLRGEILKKQESPAEIGGAGAEGPDAATVDSSD